MGEGTALPGMIPSGGLLNGASVSPGTPAVTAAEEAVVIAGGMPVVSGTGRDALEDFEAVAVGALVRRSLKASFETFVGNLGLKPKPLPEATALRLRLKIHSEYGNCLNTSSTGLSSINASTAINSLPGSGSDGPAALPSTATLYQVTSTTSLVSSTGTHTVALPLPSISDVSIGRLIRSIACSAECGADLYSTTSSSSSDIVSTNDSVPTVADMSMACQDSNQIVLNIRRPPNIARPQWHRPWKLFRVISGHQGWVQCLAVDPTNEWFVSGGNDRLIKIWDLASGRLKLSLTGHVNSIRSVVVSDRHPYMFSCGEDNKIKCWDLEQNKVVRDYHGHLSGVYCLSLHPGLDILSSGGRDAVVRVWDIRTKAAIHVLSGHQGTIMSLLSQNSAPQLISGSQDKMIRLWDLAAGKCNVVLTNHKKSVRSMAIHPAEYTFCSCAADNVKIWSCPNGAFERNVTGYNAIINCCAIKNNKNSSVLIAGTGNGQLIFWDWKSGYKYDSLTSKVQPGSLECENCIFACILDRSETRLITGECDKTIKVWKEDEESTPMTHPINWTPPREFKKY